MSANGHGFEVGVATQLGARLQIHHLQQRAYVLQQRGVLAVVRGYGGQSTGDVAVETVCQEFDRELRRAHEPAVAMVEALARASARLRATPPDAGPRTASVTAAVIAPASATVIHIGGGCAYLLRGHEVRRLTADHRFDLGPQHDRHVVLRRSLGQDDDRADVAEIVLEGGDRLIIVNETVVRSASPSELRDVVATENPQDGADAIVSMAHARITDASATAIVAAIQASRERP